MPCPVSDLGEIFELLKHHVGGQDARPAEISAGRHPSTLHSAASMTMTTLTRLGDALQSGKCSERLDHTIAMQRHDGNDRARNINRRGRVVHAWPRARNEMTLAGQAGRRRPQPLQADPLISGWGGAPRRSRKIIVVSGHGHRRSGRRRRPRQDNRRRSRLQVWRSMDPREEHA